MAKGKNAFGKAQARGKTTKKKTRQGQGKFSKRKGDRKMSRGQGKAC